MRKACPAGPPARRAALAACPVLPRLCDAAFSRTVSPLPLLRSQGPTGPALAPGGSPSTISPNSARARTCPSACAGPVAGTPRLLGRPPSAAAARRDLGEDRPTRTKARAGCAAADGGRVGNRILAAGSQQSGGPDLPPRPPIPVTLRREPRPPSRLASLDATRMS